MNGEVILFPKFLYDAVLAHLDQGNVQTAYMQQLCVTLCSKYQLQINPGGLCFNGSKLDLLIFETDSGLFHYGFELHGEHHPNLLQFALEYVNGLIDLYSQDYGT